VGSGSARDADQKVPKVTRGTLVWVNLEDADPPEMGKTRPAVVVSNSEQNAVLGTVVVVPTSSRAPEIWPLRLEIPALGKHKKSYAIVPGIRQVDKRRLVGTVGRVPDASLDRLAEAVVAYLSD
jgi:mRNA-degrading endonuclease toxin of MazEF toxin-antitoxin module